MNNTNSFRSFLEGSSKKYDSINTLTYQITGRNAEKAGPYLDSLMNKEVKDEGEEEGSDQALDIISDPDFLDDAISRVEKKFKVKIKEI